MKTWVVIPTTRSNYEVYNHLWSTMPVEAQNRSITVYQNEPVEMIVQKISGNIEIMITQNLFEYGAWVGVYKVVQEYLACIDDWFLMIHDSCAFENNTFEKIKELCFTLTRTGIDFYSLTSSGFHNISLVRKMGVRTIAEHLILLSKMTKEDAIALEGTELFKIIEGHMGRGEDLRGTEHCGFVWFKSGKKTVVRIYSINLLKFFTVQDKSNLHEQLNEDVAVHRPEAPCGDRSSDEPLR